MKKVFSLFMVVGMIFICGGFAYAAPIIDIIQAPTDYFVPTDAQKYDSPYYRWWNQDWGWTHNAISGTFTSATLSVSAYDVDWSPDDSGEHDLIYAWNNTNTKTYLGELAGSTDIWSYTTFTLDLSNFGTAINSGLQVFMDIDSTHNYNYWAVTLAKSVLSLDGGTPPPPNPTVPEPATMLLLGSGLLGLAGIRRRFKK